MYFYKGKNTENLQNTYNSQTNPEKYNSHSQHRSITVQSSSNVWFSQNVNDRKLYFIKLS